MRKIFIFAFALISVCAFAQGPAGAPQVPPQGQRPERPDGFQPGQRPQMPDGFQMPDDFDPSKMPEGSQRPEVERTPWMELNSQMEEMDGVEKARFMVDKMRDEVNLDAKQYKKVHAIFKRDYKHREYVGGGGMMMGGPMMGPPPMMGGFGGNSGLDDQYFIDQDAKLQKVLTPAQYKQWRDKYPVETATPTNADNSGFPFPGGIPGGGPGGPPPMMGGFGGPGGPF